MTLTVKIDGLAELKRNLAELPKATQRRVVQRVLLRRAAPIVAAAKAKAPVRFEDLRNSIIATTKTPKFHAGYVAPNRAAYVQARAGGATVAQAKEVARSFGTQPVRVFIGPGRHPQSSLQEFGTSFHPPQPYLRPAWESHKQSVLAGIAADLKAEIEAAAARLARKSARRTA